MKSAKSFYFNSKHVYSLLWNLTWNIFFVNVTNCRKFFAMRMTIESRRICMAQIALVARAATVGQYYNNHLQRHFTLDRTNITDDYLTKIYFCDYMRAFRRHEMYSLCVLAEGVAALPMADGRRAAAFRNFQSNGRKRVPTLAEPLGDVTAREKITLRKDFVSIFFCEKVELGWKLERM